MNILALEPYYGGSHRAFLDGLIANSRHRWTMLTLPAYKWKWRMRHSAITLAEQAAARIDVDGPWDLVFCCDMLNLAEWRGLVEQSLARLPAVVYFHENQLTYPVQNEDARDLHFAFTNLTTTLAADEVWFNSTFHRDAFLDALGGLIGRMPDYRLEGVIEQIRRRSAVEYPGIDLFAPRAARRSGPLHILWAARWEFDKGPNDLFEAIDLLSQRGVDFRLSVLGQQFRDVPDAFSRARERLAPHIDHWGYLPSRNEYHSALGRADVVVSTAHHEFFGIGVVEAIASGAFPLLPRRLAYPEILAPLQNQADVCLYGGLPDELADRLESLARQPDRYENLRPSLHETATRFSWKVRAPAIDRRFESLAQDNYRDDIG